MLHTPAAPQIIPNGTSLLHEGRYKEFTGVPHVVQITRTQSLKGPWRSTPQKVT